MSPPSSKYRHVEAVHSTPRNSYLSHDSNVSPSFLGFRNLMVLVLGKSYPRNEDFRSLFLIVFVGSCHEPALGRRELYEGTAARSFYIWDDLKSTLVRSFNLYTLSRLQASRPFTWCHTLRPCSVSPIHRIHHRVNCGKACSRSHRSD